MKKEIEIYKDPKCEEYAIFGVCKFRINDKKEIKSTVILDLEELIRRAWIKVDYKETREKILKLMQQTIDYD